MIKNINEYNKGIAAINLEIEEKKKKEAEEKPKEKKTFLTK